MLVGDVHLPAVDLLYSLKHAGCPKAGKKTNQENRSKIYSFDIQYSIWFSWNNLGSFHLQRNLNKLKSIIKLLKSPFYSGFKEETRILFSFLIYSTTEIIIFDATECICRLQGFIFNICHAWNVHITQPSVSGMRCTLHEVFIDVLKHATW